MWLPMLSKCCDCSCLWLTRPDIMDPGVSVAVDIECEVDLIKAGNVTFLIVLFRGACDGGVILLELRYY